MNNAPQRCVHSQHAVCTITVNADDLVQMLQLAHVQGQMQAMMEFAGSSTPLQLWKETDRLMVQRDKIEKTLRPRESFQPLFHLLAEAEVNVRAK